MRPLTGILIAVRDSMTVIDRELDVGHDHLRSLKKQMDDLVILVMEAERRAEAGEEEQEVVH